MRLFSAKIKRPVKLLNVQNSTKTANLKYLLISEVECFKGILCILECAACCYLIKVLTQPFSNSSNLSKFPRGSQDINSTKTSLVKNDKTSIVP